MSTNLDHNEFDRTHDEGVSAYPDERFPAPSDFPDLEHDPSTYSAPTAERVDTAHVNSETNEYGVTRATPEQNDVEPQVVGEGLTEHKPGESLGEWLRNDLAQTMEDFRIGGAAKEEES